MNIDAEETALRLERLAAVLDRAREYHGRQRDPETRQYDRGCIDAYEHCSGVLRNFLEALRGDPGDAEDVVRDLEFELEPDDPDRTA